MIHIDERKEDLYMPCPKCKALTVDIYVDRHTDHSIECKLCKWTIESFEEYIAKLWVIVQRDWQ